MYILQPTWAVCVHAVTGSSTVLFSVHANFIQQSSRLRSKLTTFLAERLQYEPGTNLRDVFTRATTSVNMLLF